LDKQTCPGTIEHRKIKGKTKMMGLFGGFREFWGEGKK
jgi:hypothetical protein